MRATEAAPCGAQVAGNLGTWKSRGIWKSGDLEPGSALAVLLIGCFTLGKFLALSGPPLPYLQHEAPTSVPLNHETGAGTGVTDFFEKTN